MILYFVIRSRNILKANHLFWVVLVCFGCKHETGVVRILAIFQHRPMFSHINGKLSLRPFE